MDLAKIRDDRRALWVAAGALVALRLAALLFGIAHLPDTGAGTGIGNDARRFHDIARAPGTAYRDFEVEVPPLALLTIETLDGPSGHDMAVRLAWFAFGCDLAAAACLAWGWGRVAAMRYLWVGAPLAIFIYFRLDMLSALLTVAGLALVRRRNDRTGGALLGAAVFAKVWPVLLLPVLALRRRTSAMIAAAAVVAGGLVAWVSWAGAGGPGQVLTMRHARGWAVSSPIGRIVSIATDAEPFRQSGAFRIGSAPGWARVGLGLTTVTLVTIAYLAARGSDAAEGVGAATAIATLLVLSPLLSHQFISWLLPWVALSELRSQRLWTLLAGACASAALLTASYDSLTAGRATVALITLRDIAVISVAVSGYRLLLRRPTTA